MSFCFLLSPPNQRVEHVMRPSKNLTCLTVANPQPLGQFSGSRLLSKTWLQWPSRERGWPSWERGSPSPIACSIQNSQSKATPLGLIRNVPWIDWSDQCSNQYLHGEEGSCQTGAARPHCRYWPTLKSSPSQDDGRGSPEDQSPPAACEVWVGFYCWTSVLQWLDFMTIFSTSDYKNTKPHFLLMLHFLMH